RVWKLTRRLCLHNQYFANLDALAAVVAAQFAAGAQPNDVLRRLCSLG
ncbi:MAG: hypothetical protein IT577_06290, partial [Verrucomicrobiae bacterium]|nr:hypothetical protein [Verrucomicrobiae bacterium]